MQHQEQNLGKQIGQAIAKYRRAAGLTQAEVAELLNMSNDAVSRMERGAIMPSAARLVQLAEIFQCEAADLLTESSHLVSDQTHRITKLLANLSESDRMHLLTILENIVAWYMKKNH